MIVINCLTSANDYEVRQCMSKTLLCCINTAIAFNEFSLLPNSDQIKFGGYESKEEH